MSASGIRAGRAYVELGVSDGLTKGLNKAQAQLKAFGDGVQKIGIGLAGVGVAAVAALAGAGKLFADTGSELHDMADRTGASVEALSALGYAAKQSGAEAADLEAGLRKMSKTVVEAAKGSDSAQEALGLLGLSVKDLDGMRPDAMFTLIGDRISKIGDPVLRSALAMEVFGKSGTKLLPMLKDGASGLANMTKQAERFGLVVSTEDADAADALGDAIDLATGTVKQLVFQVGAALAPVLTEVAQAIAVVVSGAIRWVRENRDLVASALKIAAILAGVGGALAGLGVGITLVASVLGGIATIFGVVAAAAGPLLAILGAILSPMGLIVAAAIAAGAALVYFSGIAGKVASYASEQFQGLREDAGGAFEGIRDALMAGDIELAAQVMWQGLKTIWARFTTEISKLWINWIYDLAGAFEVIKAWGGDVLDWINQASVDLISSVADAVGKLGGSVGAAAIGLKAVVETDLAVNHAPDTGQREKLLQEQIAAIESARQGELAAADSELAAQRAKLKDLVAKARDQRAAKEGEQGFFGNGSDGPPVPVSLANLAPALKAIEVHLTAAGTFNASAVQSLQSADSPMKAVAKNTADTAKNTKSLLERAREGGSEFE